MLIHPVSGVFVLINASHMFKLRIVNVNSTPPERVTIRKFISAVLIRIKPELIMRNLNPEYLELLV